MIDALTLAAFVPAALALNLTPGPDMLFCLGQGLRGGVRPALAADLGIALGCMVHVVLAGAGLGALVAALPLAFDLIRWAGIVWLLWLAWRTLRSAGPAQSEVPGLTILGAFRQGLITNLLNPKVILFILAFVPQFTDPARPLLPQFLILGGIISAGGLVVNGIVGLSAGRIGARLARSPGWGRALSRVSALIFAGLALRLALSPRG